MRIVLVPLLLIFVRQADATACEWKVIVKAVPTDQEVTYRPAVVGEQYCRNYWCRDEKDIQLNMPGLGKDNACYAAPVLNHHDGMQVDGTLATVRCEIEKSVFRVIAKSLHGQRDEVTFEATGRGGAYQVTIICQ